jgi:hypothetical protein
MHEAFERICKINQGWYATNKLSGLIWICCLVLFGCCYLSFFEKENDQEGESKES